VPELHHIYRWMRVYEVIGFCKSCFPLEWNDGLCREMLKLFDLDPQKKVKHLSKGMLTKLALLLAVSHEPELLLLDEPLSGLDPIAREEFVDGVLRAICDRGQTVLISSHMLDDVRRLADTIGIINNGRLVVQGNVDQLLSSTKRICATLRNGTRPRHSLADKTGTGSEQASASLMSGVSGEVPVPVLSGVVWQRVEGREWTITVRDFSPEKFQQIESLDGVENARVVDMGLEELFKDFVRGQKVA
jgi:ABC-2 type transport system ATP-binding protein